MRYAEGGGLTTEAPGRPDECAAAGRLAAPGRTGGPPAREDPAGGARSRCTSAAGLVGNDAALLPGGRPDMRASLTRTRLAQLRAALDLGPAVYGWDTGQMWTLARFTELIARPFHAPYTLRGTPYAH